MITANLSTSQTLTAPPTQWFDPERYLKLMASPWGRALIELQNAITVTSTAFWAERSVRAIHLPVTTGSVSSPMGLGSDSKPVPVDLLGARTYLADSMQFLLEFGTRMTPAGCYYLMPSFRGENADETHLCQFYHSEAEIPGDLNRVTATVEEYMRALCRGVLDLCPDVVRATAGTTAHLEEVVGQGAVFERMTFDEAAAFLGTDPHYIQVEKQDGRQWRTLTRAGERRLIEHCGGYVWVTHYDHLAVPFYQAFEDGQRLARNGDLLFGMGEVVGAGERHVTADQVRSSLQLHQVSEEDYAWYVAMREQDPKLTSGFGLGVERFMMWVLQHWDIRDMQLLNRANGQVCNP
ncbi:amino acid--tRNA ligase-related protein [Streptomyces sp. NPDC093801]|uniref:amino acid--tRNA ligase-related protein n=1 Tax=Streptomyces sp. NPDC093801 TaxID=3155203 RepID=UPI00344F1E87